MGKALGKSPANLWESPWDGSWSRGCRKGLEQRGPEGPRSKNVLRLIVAGRGRCPSQSKWFGGSEGSRRL